MTAEASTAPLTSLVLLVILIVLVMVITKTIKQTGIFPNPISFALAICVSLLSVLGMVQQFGGMGTAGGIAKNSETVEPNGFDFLLIPYTAMALAILLMLLLLAIAWLVNTVANRRRCQHVHKEIQHQSDRPQEQLSKPSNANISSSRQEERLDDKSS